MNKFLVVGDIYSEDQFFVQTIPVENEFSVAAQVTTLTGSKTINSARVMTRLNNAVDFYAKAGVDDRYLKVLADFKRYGINIDLINQTENVKTGQIAVATDEMGKSAISIYFGANSTVTPEDIQTLEANLHNYNMVYGATHLPLNCLYKLIEICNRKRVPLFLDFPNPQKTVDLNKLANVDYISPNREEAELIFDENIRTVEDAFRVLTLFRKFCNGTIILTLDIDGCAIFEKNAKDPVYFKTTPIQSADSNGAGDIFKAVFMSEILKTKNIETSIQHGQEIATRSVALKGVDFTLENLDLTF
jgi:ribokinase